MPQADKVTPELISKFAVAFPNHPKLIEAVKIGNSGEVGRTLAAIETIHGLDGNQRLAISAYEFIFGPDYAS